MDYYKKHTDLIKLLKKGNIHAFNEIYRIYSSQIYFFSLKLLHNPNVAEEIVQDVFLKIWVYKEKLKDELSFNSFIFTITINLIRKHYRRKKIIEKFITQNNFTNIQKINIDYIRLSEIIDNLLEKLPEQRRKIFIKSRLEELSNEEIAKELNISKKTVENQLSSALKFIRNNLEKYLKLIILIISICLEGL